MSTADNQAAHGVVWCSRPKWTRVGGYRRCQWIWMWGNFVDICCQLVQRVDLVAGHPAGRTSCMLKTSYNGKTSRGGKASNAQDNDRVVTAYGRVGIADGFETVTQRLGRLPNKTNILFRWSCTAGLACRCQASPPLLLDRPCRGRDSAACVYTW